MRHVSELEEKEQAELISERDVWRKNRSKILENRVFTEKDLSLSHLCSDDKTLILNLINAHKNIFAHSKTDRGFAPFQYDIDWKNNTPPPLENFFQRQYATAPSQREPIKSELNRLLELGVIEPASSAANIPMIAVIKSRPGDKNKVRLVLNFIQLNHSISERHFPIQSSNELLQNLGSIINKYNKLNKVGYFTSLDIRNAFHTIGLNREDRLYTAFSFERSQYISKFLPFGLRSSPSTWCEMLHRILNTILNKYEEIFFYVDDLIIYTTKTKTIEILNEIFEFFQENGLVLSADKASFLLDEIVFLGKTITRSGVSECDTQLSKITSAERPKTLKQLQKFLGMIAFVCNCIPNINFILKKLYDLVGECQNRAFYWNDELQKCFLKAKEAMNTSIETAHFDPNLPVFYVADTSDLGCGFAYGNFVTNDNGEKEYSICGIGSKVLPKNLLSSSTKIKELYGILIGLKEFGNKIVGCDITIFTDNFGAYRLIASNNWNDASIPRVVMNCFSVIEALQAKIEHMSNSSKLLEFADAISRRKLVVDKQHLNSLRTKFIEQRPTINLQEIINAQSSDPDCQKIMLQCKKNLITKFRNKYFKYDGQLFAGNTESLINKIVIPSSYANQIVKFFHVMNLHVGTNKVIKLIQKESIYIFRLNQVATEVISKCLTCQLNKPSRKPKVETFFKVPSLQPFINVEADLFSLERSDLSYNFCLVLVDRFSGFIWARPIKTKHSHIVAKQIALFATEYGLSGNCTIHSDNGTEFAGLNQTVANFLCVNLSTNSGYNPSSNGSVETANGKIKRGLQSLDIDNDDFDFNLQLVVCKLNHMPNDRFEGLSAFEIITGRKSPVLINYDFTETKNFCEDVCYAQAQEWLSSLSKVQFEIGQMQINNFHNQILNYHPPTLRIRRNDIVIALSKTEPSNFRKNMQLDFTGPYIVQQIRDLNRAVLRHIVTGDKIKRSLKLIQKLNLDPETYKIFKNGQAEIKKGVLSLPQKIDKQKMESILKEKAKCDEELVDILKTEPIENSLSEDKQDIIEKDIPILKSDQNQPKGYNLRPRKNYNRFSN